MASQGLAAAPPIDLPDDGADQLAEIWGDVVSRRQLGRALLIGAALSLAAYEIALRLFQGLTATPATDKALAMLAGILGCILAGAICARLFPPKRIVVDEVVGDATWRREVLAQLEAEAGPIGDIDTLPEAVIREMKEVGLYDLFRDHSRREA